MPLTRFDELVEEQRRQEADRLDRELFREDPARQMQNLQANPPPFRIPTADAFNAQLNRANEWRATPNDWVFDPAEGQPQGLTAASAFRVRPTERVRAAAPAEGGTVTDRQVLHDLEMNYKECFLVLKVKGKDPEPAYVRAISYDGPGLFSIHYSPIGALATRKQVSVKDVKFLKDLPPLGAVEVNGSVMYLSRTIERQFKRGYTNSNVSIRPVFGPKQKLADALLSNFTTPSKKEAGKAIKEVIAGKVKGAVITNELAVGIWNNFANPFVSWNDNYIGWVEDHLILMKEFEWLRPKMEDHMEIQDVV